MQAPLTTDYAFVKSVISAAGPYQISAQGTNLAEAIEKAEDAYEDGLHPYFRRGGPRWLRRRRCFGCEQRRADDLHHWRR